MATSEYIQYPNESGSGGVTSLNGLVGALSLIAGTGISITPSGTSITITNTGSSNAITSLTGPVTATGPGAAATTIGTGVVTDANLADVYFLLAGRAGGQVANGDTAASGNLSLQSTSNATKGFVSVVDGSTLAVGPFGTYYDIPALAPGTPFVALQESSSIPGFTLLAATADNSNYPGLVFGHSRGTFGSGAYLQNNDVIFGINSYVYDGFAVFDYDAITIQAIATENQSGSALGSQLQFFAIPNTTTTGTNYLNLGGSTQVQFPTIVSGVIRADSSGNLSSTGLGTAGQALTTNGTTWAPSSGVVAVYGMSTNMTTTAGTQMNFDAVRVDTNSSVTTGASWKFTAPFTGNYNVAVIAEASTNTSLTLFRNGTGIVYLVTAQTGGISSGSQVVVMTAGDTLDLRPDTTATFTNLGGMGQSATEISIFLIR